MYYEIEIQVTKEGTESKGIYSYDNKDSAVATFHQKMASGMKNTNLKSVLNMVVNEHGGTEVKEFWLAPVEPEPEPEPEA